MPARGARENLEEQGLNPKLSRSAVCPSIHAKGRCVESTIRAAPSPEAKLVRCTRGSIYDVAVDLRPESPTFKDWIGVVAHGHGPEHALRAVEGCGHGFLTLEDETEVLYQMSEFYYPELARGVRWDDPTFGRSFGPAKWK